MVKKMKFPFPFKFTGPYPSSTTTTTTTTSSWPWTTCANTPKTFSFRVTNTKNNENYPPCFSEHEEKNDENVLGVLKSSDRLFFEPGRTSSILETTKTSTYKFPYKESASVMDMDSTDPFVDFRVSMEEMVETHGLKDWAGLEDLLTCYLKLNRKSNHGYIVCAFVDLVLHLVLANSSDSLNSPVNEIEYSSNSFTSPFSFSSSTESSTIPSLENIVVEHGESSCSNS